MSDFCAVAGVSLVSLYRSAHIADIRRHLAAPGAVASLPEVAHLHAQIRQLTGAGATLRSQHNAEVRELRATVSTYANQIQVLALRVGQLEEDHRKLLARLASAGDNVTPLRS